MTNTLKTMTLLAITMVATIFFASCKKERIETMNVGKNTIISDDNENYYRDLGEPNTDSIAPMISSNLPIFPFEVLYVVNKEYEMVVEGRSEKSTFHGTPILSYQQPEYVELRLIELYPDLAYEGVMEDSRNFYDSVSAVYDAYLWNIQNLGATRKLGADKENIPYISDENEIEVLGMTEIEKENYLQYIKLSGKESFASLDEILKVGGGNSFMKASPTGWIMFGCICALVVNYGSYVYNRALMCCDRAVLKTKLFYGENIPTGVKGDAFRHISVSVLLRWYLSEFKAYLIMDIAWELFLGSSNPPCDRQMDLHNNFVGRFAKYFYFRVDFDWEGWMINVRDFVNNPDQNGAYKNWDNSTSWWTAYWGRVATSGSKYIYYNNN